MPLILLIITAMGCTFKKEVQKKFTDAEVFIKIDSSLHLKRFYKNNEKSFPGKIKSIVNVSQRAAYHQEIKILEEKFSQPGEPTSVYLIIQKFKDKLPAANSRLKDYHIARMENGEVLIYNPNLKPIVADIDISDL